MRPITAVPNLGKNVFKRSAAATGFVSIKFYSPFGTEVTSFLAHVNRIANTLHRFIQTTANLISEHFRNSVDIQNRLWKRTSVRVLNTD